MWTYIVLIKVNKEVFGVMQIECYADYWKHALYMDSSCLARITINKIWRVHIFGFKWRRYLLNLNVCAPWSKIGSDWESEKCQLLTVEQVINTEFILLITLP